MRGYWRRVGVSRRRRIFGPVNKLSILRWRLAEASLRAVDG